jgi:acetyltransferase-like isoleucine patch superfamily enzyme
MMGIIFSLLDRIIYRLLFFPLYKISLGAIGSGSRLKRPTLSGASRIFIGKNVYIRKNGWLAAEPVTGDSRCKMSIGDGTYVGNSCHFFASSSIEIGKKVLFADKVYVSDNVHSFDDPTIPVIDQPVRQLKKVTIGDGAWIGENVCVIGASVGKNSVVGANSVVNSDIPDYCVAVGAPARIVKRYDFEKKCWNKTDPQGNFI